MDLVFLYDLDVSFLSEMFILRNQFAVYCGIIQSKGGCQ